MGGLKCCRIRDIQQREEGKQHALGKEMAAATSLERRKRKKTYVGFVEFRHYAERRGRERERERCRGEKRGVAGFKVGKMVA